MKQSKAKNLARSGVDGRTKSARRLRDVFERLLNELGDASDVSAAQVVLAQRAATLIVQCETLEARIMQNEDIDHEHYAMLVDRLGRCFGRIKSLNVSSEVLRRVNILPRTFGDGDPTAAHPSEVRGRLNAARAAERPASGHSDHIGAEPTPRPSPAAGGPPCGPPGPGAFAPRGATNKTTELETDASVV